jgi:hypothetical protein
MFHYRRQRHAERLRQRADRQSGLLGEPGQQGPPRRVGKRREGAVERHGIKLNHVVNYRRTVGAVKPHASDRWLQGEEQFGAASSLPLGAAMGGCPHAPDAPGFAE